LLTVSRSFMNVANSVLWRMAIILKANKVNLFVSSALFVFWYHSPKFLDTPHICDISGLRVNDTPVQKRYLLCLITPYLAQWLLAPHCTACGQVVTACTVRYIHVFVCG
jgi:hypothetical protein